MTIPSERTRAVDRTRNFLYALCDPQKTPRVPKDVREQAYRCLRHYPGSFDLKISADKCPSVWGKVEL